MTGFALHPEAVSDLEGIWDYIADRNPDAADRVIEEFFAAFAGLAATPAIGHRRPDLTARPLRFVAVREYLVAYAPELRPLQVIAVIHGRRNPRVISAVMRGRGS
ncbi:MAG: type II toxin-antitoxin system RelE/ParE family toxin [Rhodospirillaceae bacterium]|nr:type II toxin-antitoxin system RelE/ParE family toxin [Rhodospirillaceae bacterium]